jgi:hypothetical protein
MVVLKSKHAKTIAIRTNLSSKFPSTQVMLIKQIIRKMQTKLMLAQS